MPYTTTIPVEFPLPAHAVYEALCDLGLYPQWNSGMIRISRTGRMEPGIEYETVTDVLGHENHSRILVVALVPDERIILNSQSGLVMFEAVMHIKPVTAHSCTVTTTLHFEFSHQVFALARPMIESMAGDRIRGDLETLRDLLMKSRRP
jgi:hypothetical protein